MTNKQLCWQNHEHEGKEIESFFSPLTPSEACRNVVVRGNVLRRKEKKKKEASLAFARKNSCD